jgi:centromeric protein E
VLLDVESVQQIGRSSSSIEIHISGIKMSEKIQVAVRIRKLLPRELNGPATTTGMSPTLWQWKDNQIWSKAVENKKFTYDRVFPPSEDNEDVHRDLVETTIKSVLLGFNATIFAYGQTASGMNEYLPWFLA